MKLTEAQRDAVEQRGSNLLVSASAGSGKTEVLARRCVDLVAFTMKRPTKAITNYLFVINDQDFARHNFCLPL